LKVRPILCIDDACYSSCPTGAYHYGHHICAVFSEGIEVFRDVVPVVLYSCRV
jgi:hypothetical protein